MQIDDNVLNAIRRQLRVTFRVTGPGGRQLGRQVEDAVDSFQDQWDASPPVADTGAMMSPPMTSVTSTSPSVVVSLAEIGDGEATAARLAAVLHERLPAAAKASLLSVPSKAFDRRAISLLGMRLAIVGTPEGYAWTLSKDVASRTDDAVERWLSEVDFPAVLWMDPLWGGRVPLMAGDLREALAAKRARRDRARFVALGQHQLRAAAVDFYSAHVSFGSGVPKSMGDQFDWSRHLQLLEGVATGLADITQAAFVAFCAEIGKLGHSAFMRALDPPKSAGRYNLAPGQERQLEEDNLLPDAQGVFYLNERPADLPPGYEIQPFAGSLFRIRLPDSERWLTQLPEASLLQATRTELAHTLMRPTSC